MTEYVNDTTTGQDPYRSAENVTRCPECGSERAWNDEDGLAGQECGGCGREFNGTEAATETQPMKPSELGRYVCVPAGDCLHSPSIGINADGVWVKSPDGSQVSSAHRDCHEARQSGGARYSATIHFADGNTRYNGIATAAGQAAWLGCYGITWTPDPAPRGTVAYLDGDIQAVSVEQLDI